MLKVGITGGIGSGKTTVCKVFELLEVPVYYADDRAKNLYHEDPQLKEALKTTFGNEIFDHNNMLNKAKLADLVFNNTSAMAQLNNLVHPAVRRDFTQWVQAQNAFYVIQEAALLVETGSYQNLDGLITVTTPLEIRTQRIVQRDQTTREKVLERMNNQLNEEDKVAKSDFTIANDGNNLLIPQVLDLHHQFKSGQAW